MQSVPVVVLAALLSAVVGALILSRRFRQDMLRGDGQAKVLGILTVNGAAVVLIIGLLLGALVWLAPRPERQPPPESTQVGRVARNIQQAFAEPERIDPGRPPVVITRLPSPIETAFGAAFPEVAGAAATIEVYDPELEGYLKYLMVPLQFARAFIVFRSQAEQCEANQGMRPARRPDRSGSFPTVSVPTVSVASPSGALNRRACPALSPEGWWATPSRRSMSGTGSPTIRVGGNDSPKW